MTDHYVDEVIQKIAFQTTPQHMTSLGIYVTKEHYIPQLSLYISILPDRRIY